MTPFRTTRQYLLVLLTSKLFFSIKINLRGRLVRAASAVSLRGIPLCILLSSVKRLFFLEIQV